MPNGLFIPTTQAWDVDEVYGTDVNTREFKDLIVRLYQNMNSMALVVNKKESAYYDLNEFITGQQFYPDSTDSTTEGDPIYRDVYRKVIKFGALPNAAAKSVAHGITLTTGSRITRLYGAATNPTAGALSFLPLPYASPVLVNNIELSMNATHVTVTTGSNRTAYTECDIMIEIINP